MGEAFLYGNGSETELAVKVVGGTQKPSNAKQGTIWVNTDQKITAWTIQVEEPAEPIEGMVWIYNLTSTRFNALKKNGIWFTPTQAKQYVSGMWVKKTGEYYNNNQWTVLFEATINVTYTTGLICTATNGTTTLTAPDTSGTWVCVVPNTGTWTVSCGKKSKSIQITTNGQSEIIDLIKTYLYTAGDTNKLTAVGWSAFSGQIATKPTITDKTSYIEIRIDGSDGGRTGVAYFQKMELDYASKIHADLSFIGENEYVNSNMFGVWSVINSGYYSSNAVASVNVNSSGTSYDIDVSNLEGEYYIGFGIRRGRNTPYIKVTSCYCE